MREKVKHTLSANRHLFYFILFGRPCSFIMWIKFRLRMLWVNWCCRPLLLPATAKCVLCIIILLWLIRTNWTSIRLAGDVETPSTTYNIFFLNTDKHAYPHDHTIGHGTVLPSYVSLFGAGRGSARHLGDSSVSTTLAIERDTLIYLACIRIVSMCLCVLSAHGYL